MTIHFGIIQIGQQSCFYLLFDYAYKAIQAELNSFGLAFGLEIWIYFSRWVVGGKLESLDLYLEASQIFSLDAV